MGTKPFDLAALLAANEGCALDLLDEHINPAYAAVLRTIGFDANYVRGQGAYLYDDHNRRYIDCLGGYAVFNVGRNHPVIRDAIRQAMDLDLPNLPGVGTFRTAGLLARELLKVVPGACGGIGSGERARGGELDTVYFTNSGTEGCEVALKYARAATGRSRVIYCSRSYHGLTLGALSVNGNHEFREPFGKLLEGTTEIPFNDLEALERELVRGDVACFMVEPIQGKGVNMPSDEYLRGASELCAKHGSLFALDEVQTGYGRTGKMFACEHFGGGQTWVPDIMVTAKALSGGYIPVCAVFSKRWIHTKVFPSMAKCSVQQSTFGMNDLAMAAGLATLHVLREERLIEHAASVGERLMGRLRGMVGKHQMVKEVRGKGLMIGIEYAEPKSLTLRAGWNLLHKMDQSLFCQALLMPLMTEHRILCQVAGYRLDVIKLIPPLVLSEADADEVADAFEAVTAACHRFPGPVWEVGTKLSSAALKRLSGNRNAPQPAGA